VRPAFEDERECGRLAMVGNWLDRSSGSDLGPKIPETLPTADSGNLAFCEFAAHSHSIISEPLNRLFNLSFCPPQRTNTVRHTVETDRWRAIDPDRSRTTPKHTLSYSLFPHPNTFTPRPVLPSSTKSFTVERTPKKPAGAQLI
jgi:hypothetical protein